jgi:hypothetical protein
MSAFTAPVVIPLRRACSIDAQQNRRDLRWRDFRLVAVGGLRNCAGEAKFAAAGAAVLAAADDLHTSVGTRRVTDLQSQ